MQHNLDWHLLVTTNRAKAHGVFWTTEEEESLRSGKMTADEIRSGVGTVAKEKVEKVAKAVVKKANDKK